MRRVVITGQGTVNPLGHSVSETFAAFQNGVCAIGELEFRDVERLGIRIGGQVKGFRAEDCFDRQKISLYDRFTQFALVAAQEAIDQSGLEFNDSLTDRAGVALGTAGGGLNTWDDSYREVYQEQKSRVHPFVVPRLMNNAAASHVSMQHNLRGPGYSVSTACSSSNHAIGMAFQMIRTGLADVMLTGGSESMLCFGGIKAWEGLRVMSQDCCRPFSADRNGMVQGEGAAIFVLEEYEFARKRGAAIIAEIAGFAMTSDAADIVMPSVSGAARAIGGALADSGLSAGDIGYINAHGTGTAANDRTECAAVRQVFGQDAERLLLSSTKSMHGHLIGGTGAVELLACTMALNESVVPPTINYRKPDPECDLDVVPNEARRVRIDAALSNAFAFGGLNAVLAIRKL
ncbi:MAG: beta-ketoacyl-[acyl-carrier-protein] synthase family protein [Rhodobacteraceae bacterium]|nr:beta-ketoacyl-[acyl-carrier-protein] synthase family protein [Paracoccaceae bacterium]